mmetsp:Transcript_10371/g.38249  ORF Transcript_10371/g.38249 Transcript_10371/m.38249 type:complete len:418 (-) Transcript_10371:1458-2711(-)
MELHPTQHQWRGSSTQQLPLYQVLLVLGLAFGLCFTLQMLLLDAAVPRNRLASNYMEDLVSDSRLSTGAPSVLQSPQSSTTLPERSHPSPPPPPPSMPQAADTNKTATSSKVIAKPLAERGNKAEPAVRRQECEMICKRVVRQTKKGNDPCIRDPSKMDTHLREKKAFNSSCIVALQDSSFVDNSTGMNLKLWAWIMTYGSSYDTMRMAGKSIKGPCFLSLSSQAPGISYGWLSNGPNVLDGAPDFSEYLLKTAIATLRDIHKRNLDSVLALNLGLGIGAMAHSYSVNYPFVTADFIELDGPMIDIAREWFCAPQDDRYRYIKGDASVYVRQSKKQYHLIVLDCYDDGNIPAELASSEFLEATVSRLLPKGVLAINMFDLDTTTDRDAFLGTLRSLCHKVSETTASKSNQAIICINH